MSHDELVDMAERHLRGTRRCTIVLTERGDGEVVDAIGWTWAGCSVMIECKVSLSDYYADAKKPRCAAPDFGVGCERFYLTPKNLLRPDQLRESWGLLEARGPRVRTVVKAPHRDVYDWRSEQRMLRNEVLRWHAAMAYAPDLDLRENGAAAHALEHANLLHLAHSRCPRCKFPIWEWRELMRKQAEKAMTDARRQG